MKVVFHGATHTVTGSQHEVQAAGRRFLLDCGFFQGPPEIAQKINCCFDFPANSVDAVALSHGHADHCANLPNLVKQGFHGPIYATPATIAISALMLLDSAKIQEENAGRMMPRADGGWEPSVPMYTMADAEKTIKLFVPVEYRQPRDIGGVTVELRDAGHILGSAAVSVVETAPGARGRRLVFTGDVGRPNSPVVNNPDPFTEADVLISECTYGGRRHEPISEVPGILKRVIAETSQRGGWLLVPSFALGRTQAMIHEFHVLSDTNGLRNLPVYVDSPLASRLTQVFRQFGKLTDDETRAMLTPFDFPGLTYVQSVDESRALNMRPGPGIIIAASGMCEGGRILHHLKHHLRDSRTTVLLPGFQAQGTLGRKIQDHWKEVPILGDMIPLHARVEKIDGLSAHGDGKELLEYVLPLKKSGPRVFLVHGEDDAATAHKKDLMAAGFGEVTIPSRGDSVEV